MRHDELGDRFFAAVEKGDIDAIRELYTPDVRVWLNVTGEEQDRDANLRTLAWLTSKVSGVRYEDVRRYEVTNGFVQQHVLRGTAVSGTAIEIAACLVVTVVDGRIARIEEYLDSAKVAPMFS